MAETVSSGHEHTYTQKWETYFEIRRPYFCGTEISIQTKAAFSRGCHVVIVHSWYLHDAPSLRLVSKELLLWYKGAFSRSMNSLPLYLKIIKLKIQSTKNLNSYRLEMCNYNDDLLLTPKQCGHSKISDSSPKHRQSNTLFQQKKKAWSLFETFTTKQKLNSLNLKYLKVFDKFVATDSKRALWK